MLQGGIETRLILGQLDILPQILSVKEGILYVCLFTYTLSATSKTEIFMY